MVATRDQRQFSRAKVMFGGESAEKIQDLRHGP
jgi:hypothetical protein